MMNLDIDRNFDIDRITETKRQKELEGYPGRKSIRINPVKKDFSAYDGFGQIQTFIDKLKDKESEKLKDNIKDLKKDNESQDFKKTIRTKV